MKITVTGSLGNISRLLVTELVQGGADVQVITTDAQKGNEIVQIGARPLVGSIENAEFVKRSFAGSDAVYLMIPPNKEASDLKGYIKKVGEQYAQAIKETSVSHVVNLSSIGAHLEYGLGPTGANHHVEARLNELEQVGVLHLRPGMFLTNFYGAIPMIRHQHSLGNNFDGLVKVPLTHPKDIAKAAYNALIALNFSGKQIRYVVSDEKNGFDIARILGDAIGQPDIRWIEFSDDELLNILVANGFSRQMALVYMVEIGIALRDGSLMEDYSKNRHRSVGATGLEEFSSEFAGAYLKGQI